MRFPMNGDGRFLARRFDQAEDFPGGLVEPVLLVVNAILLLHFQVTRARAPATAASWSNLRHVGERPYRAGIVISPFWF